VTLPSSSIDPPATGVRVLYGDRAGGAASGNLVDRVVPPGAYDPATRRGWIASNGSFTYVDRLPSGDVRKLSIRRDPRVPGRYKLQLKAKDGAYAGDRADLPIHAIVVLGPTIEQCGEWSFPGTPPTRPYCAANATGSGVKCR